MSFAELKSADVSRKRKEITIKVGEKDVKFQANEISYFQRLHLANLQQNGGDPFTQLIVYSITDANGKACTFDDVVALKPEYAEAFFVAASEVNATDEAEKN